jgi:hypothetical protein
MKNLAQEGEAIAPQQQFRSSHERCGRRKSLSRNSDLEWTEHKGAAGPKGTDLVRWDQRCWGRRDGWLSSGSSATRGEENSRIGRAILSSGSGGLESTAPGPSPSQTPPPPISFRSRAFQATGTPEEIFKYTYTFQPMVCTCFFALSRQTGKNFVLILRVPPEIRPICRLQAGPEPLTLAAWPRSPRWAWHSGAFRAPHVLSHPGPT